MELGVRLTCEMGSSLPKMVRMPMVNCGMVIAPQRWRSKSLKPSSTRTRLCSDAFCRRSTISAADWPRGAWVRVRVRVRVSGQG